MPISLVGGAPDSAIGPYLDSDIHRAPTTISKTAQGMTVTTDMVDGRLTPGWTVTPLRVSMAPMPALRTTPGMAVTGDMMIMSGSSGGCFG